MSLIHNFNTTIRTCFDKTVPTSVLTKYKGKPSIDAGLIYAPYIPIGSDLPVKCIEICGWTLFCFIDKGPEFNSKLIEWCKNNLGMQHKGIYLGGLYDLCKIHVWLGNFGNWRYDYQGGDYIVRIWVKRPQHVALMKLTWL